jgi:hypothetical protein
MESRKAEGVPRVGIEVEIVEQEFENIGMAHPGGKMQGARKLGTVACQETDDGEGASGNCERPDRFSR